MAANLNRQHRRVRLFELGKTFHKHGKDIFEIERIGGVATGAVWPEQWGEREREVDFHDVKSDLEALFALTGAGNEFSFHAASHRGLHPGRSADIRRAGKVAGRVGQLHPEQQASLEIVQNVYLFELDTKAATRREMPQYQGISKFPAIRRDLAVLVDEAVSAQELLDLVKNIAGKDLTNLELFDVFRREGVDSKRKSLAFSLTLQASSRTLRDKEVDSIVDRTLVELRNRFGAVLRT